MDLLVIRHAIAAPREDYPEDDAARPLTAKGTKRFKQVVRGLDALGIELAAVLHSPWRRAVETAQLLEPIIHGSIDVALRATDLLTASPKSELFGEISTAGANGAVAVVGHEPWLGELIATLCFADARRGEQVPMRKGGVAWLDGTAVPGGMVLRALMPPKVLRVASE